MKSILFGLGVTIVALAAAIAASSAAWVFWDAWKATDLEAFRALIGAFAGAFFAYLFVRFGDAMKKVYDRKEKNHTSLVRLQHYFNDCLNTTSDNLYIANDCTRIFAEARLTSGGHPIYMNVFHQYQVDVELMIGLTNLDLINEMASLNAGLKKLNSSLATIDRAYGQIRDAFIAKTISETDYLANARLTRDRCAQIQPFLSQTQGDLVRLFAVAQLLLKDPPFLVRITQAFVRTKYPKGFEALLEHEIAKVKAGMDAIAKASEQRIREAEASAAQPIIPPDLAHKAAQGR
jgi:hypothetical protein